MARNTGWMTRDEFGRTPHAGAQLRKGFTVDKLEPTEEPRRLRFVISTGDVDRDNDTIDPNGWDLTNFQANPVVLWAHSHSLLPVGRAVQVGVEAGKLVAVAEFASHQFAETVLQLLKGGFLKATSVGFRALEYAINEERRGIDFKRQELLEFSIVPVPANQHALIAASAAGVDLEPVRQWVQETIEAWPGDIRLKGKAWEKLGAIDVRRRVGDLEVGISVTGDAEARLDGLLAKIDAVSEKAELLAQHFAIPDMRRHQSVQFVTEPAADTVRWDKSLPVSFDITAQEFAAQSVEPAEADGAKRGRGLSAANERRLRKAAGCANDCQSSIAEVLDTLAEQNTESGEGEFVLELADMPVPAQARQADAPEYVLELADEPDGIEVDQAALRDGLREAVAAAMGQLVQESVERTLNRIRGRVE